MRVGQPKWRQVVYWGWSDNAFHPQPRNPHEFTSSQRMQIKLCRWGKGCAAREAHCLPSRSRRSRESTTKCRTRRLSSFSTTRVVSVCVCVWRTLQSRLRGDWQSSRSCQQNYPMPSASGEARGMWPWVVGQSSSTTSTPMKRAACSADSNASCVLHYCYYSWLMTTVINDNRLPLLFLAC